MPEPPPQAEPALETRFKRDMEGAKRNRDKIKDELRRAVPSDGIITADMIDCVAGLESTWNPESDGPGDRTGLYQYNRSSWENEYNNSTSWSVANVQDIKTSTSVALGGLGYRLGVALRQNPEYTLEQGLARAFSMFNGEFGKYGQTGYGEAIINCSKEIGTDFEAGYRHIWNLTH